MLSQTHHLVSKTTLPVPHVALGFATFRSCLHHPWSISTRNDLEIIFVSYLCMGHTAQLIQVLPRPVIVFRFLVRLTQRSGAGDMLLIWMTALHALLIFSTCMSISDIFHDCYQLQRFCQDVNTHPTRNAFRSSKSEHVFLSNKRGTPTPFAMQGYCLWTPRLLLWACTWWSWPCSSCQVRELNTWGTLSGQRWPAEGSGFLEYGISCEIKQLPWVTKG